MGSEVIMERWVCRELELEAVRLISDRGVSYVRASKDLNVQPRQPCCI